MPDEGSDQTTSHAAERRQWAAHLRSLAEPVLAGTGLVEGDPAAAGLLDTFRDEAGHHRHVDRPLLAWILSIHPGEPEQTPTLDEPLWWRLASGEPNWTDLVRPGDGPLLLDPEDESVGVEVRTEAELSAVHALHRLGQHHRDTAAIDRAFAAARWHTDVLQPDNATNHPWGIHAFLELAISAADPAVAGAARAHAGTLLHNAMVALGHPDRFSALLLLDSARALESVD